MASLRISKKDARIHGSLTLDGSKSISNRLLMIRAISKEPVELHELSASEDTQTLDRLLSRDSARWDAGAAGTCYRFLTAYLATRPGTRELTGSPRMLERPVGPLVDALRELGANISYLGKPGYPPLQITGAPLNGGSVSLSPKLSSQFVSALLLIAPALPGGLTIKFTAEPVSFPYIRMTLAIMEHFGVSHRISGDEISIAPQSYRSGSYTIEPDWSAASYYYLTVALASDAQLALKGFKPDSIQGDRAIVPLMQNFGVSTDFRDDGIVLSQMPVQIQDFQYNFKDTPDLVQSLAACCAAFRIPGVFENIGHLRIKETDRISALASELAKLGIEFSELNGKGRLTPMRDPVHPICFRVFDDHRMAMALAPLAMRYGPVIIDRPEVVSKSNPDYWKHLQALGFEVEAVS